MKWRNEGRYLMPGGCATCVTSPGHHTWRQIGFDRERRPVIFYSVGHATVRSRATYTPFTTLTHVIALPALKSLHLFPETIHIILLNRLLIFSTTGIRQWNRALHLVSQYVLTTWVRCLSQVKDIHSFVSHQWIVDAKELTWADCRMIARLTGVMEEGGMVEGHKKKETFISVLANNYPQTLGSFLMLRPPAFLFTVWKAVKLVVRYQF